MRKILLFSTLFLCLHASAQYNSSSPWMQELIASKQGTSKTAEPTDLRFSIDEISEAFWEYWKDKDKDAKGSGFKPFLRWENYWKHMADANGMLPTSAEILAAYKRKMDGRFSKNPTANWTEVGPNAPGQLAGSLPGSGRINSFAVHPTDPTVIFAGAPAGGLWKSTDSGTTWNSLFNGFLQIGVSGIAIDNNNPDIMYIATGDDDARDSFSLGVYKSTDGGNTWAATGLSAENDNSFSQSAEMSGVIIDPSDSNVLWGSTNFGLYKSEDAGVTWDRKLNGNIKDFELHPSNSDIAYAVTNNRYFRTSDGENFTEISDFLPTSSGRLILAVSPASPAVVYLLSAATGANNFEYQGLFRSNDTGLTFTETANTTNVLESSQAWFDLALTVNPDNANEVFVGCLNIWRSQNGGGSFTRLNRWFVNDAAYTHADIHTLAYFGDRLYAGTDGGLFSSDDDGNTFTDRTGDMGISQFYRMSIGKNLASKIAVGSQDNAGFVYNNGSWSGYTGGDGMDYEVSPSNPDLIYGFVQFGSPLFITTNSGQSVTTVDSPDNGNITGNWITPLAVSTTGEVYAGYDALYRLNGSSWEKISSNLSSTEPNLSDIEVSTTDPNVIYVARNDLMYRSTNGGVSFVFIDRFDAEISDMAIHSTDPNTVYVTTSRRVGTSDSGQPNDIGVLKVTIGSSVDVEDLTRNLSIDQGIFSIVHQGKHSDNPIFVGTSLGVFRLDDTLTEWEDYFTNLPSVAVSDLDISLEKDNEVLVASTYGRGVWQTPIPVQIQQDDIAIVSLTPDTNFLDCAEIMPTVTVQNNGLNDITQIDFTYSVNGGSDQNFQFNGTINPDGIETIQLPSLGQLDFGQTSLNIGVSIAGETQLDDNNASVTFNRNQFANGDQLFDFEAGNPTLLAFNETGGTPVWEQGAPTGTILGAAASGTQVWGTNLEGNYPDATKSFLVSGCYELANIVAPVLKFNMAYDLEQDFDVVYVEYSTDEGANWSLLGTTNSQPNWYVSDRTFASSGGTDCQNCPGGQWTGTDGTIREYAYDFVANANAGETDLTGEAKVVFRIVFHSDPLENNEGAIIDDLVVTGFQDDEDDDNDGVLDVDDNCPVTANADQADNDGDGIGDVCDDDDDNDGILDVDDNCPLIANAGQEDFDGDGIGNVCDSDIDGDGVPNSNDLCDNTPANAVVDVDGCAVFSLPSDNFTLNTVGESCIGSDNGQINLTAAQSNPYTATLSSGGTMISMQTFTDQVSFDNLEAGAYSICITVDGQADFEQCFDVTLTQPLPLGVASKVDNLDAKLTLELSGAEVYYIEVNDALYQTSDSTFELDLKEPVSTLKVRTNKACQGTFEQKIVLENQLLIFPNPLDTEILNVFLGTGNKGGKIQINIFNSVGQQVLSREYTNQGNSLEMNLSAYPSGLYFLNISGVGQLQTFKLIKR